MFFLQWPVDIIHQRPHVAIHHFRDDHEVALVLKASIAFAHVGMIEHVHELFLPVGGVQRLLCHGVLVEYLQGHAPLGVNVKSALDECLSTLTYDLLQFEPSLE